MSAGAGAMSDSESVSISFPPAVPGSALLSLDECEDRIEHLLRLCASVCAGLSEVSSDSPAQVTADVREFHASLRLVYASILAHIRASAGEGQPSAGSAGAASSAASHGGAGAAAREYRRNVYLDAQQMTVLLEGLELARERIQSAQKQYDALQQPAAGHMTGAGTTHDAVVQR